MLSRRLDTQIKLTPGNVAVKTALGSLSYGELGLQAGRVAHAIRALISNRDAVQEPNVGLVFDHGADSIAAVAGALFSGYTYVPIHAGLPLDRIVYMISRARVNLLVTSSRHALIMEQIRSKHAVEVVYLDGLADRTLEAAPLPPKPVGYQYLLFTSGSTGHPKAIEQKSESVAYFADNLRARIGLTSSDRVVMFAHFAFDAAVVDIFSALLSGAALHPYALNTQTGATALPEYLARERITIWHSVPSLFRHLTGSLAEDSTFSEMRVVLLGGEPIRSQDVSACRKHFPNATFGNIYGQTESSINSLWLLPPGVEDYRVSLGEPFDRTQLLVAGDDGALVEPLGVGQIVVACEHLAPGYWDEPALTSNAFSEDSAAGRLYWTGDLGRLLPDGRIEFAGRRDHQIKIRGMRIELEEIERHLCGHPDIADAIVSCVYEEAEPLFLSCYWERRFGRGGIQEKDIRDHLARFLPDYMVPRCYLEMVEWPRNANGKLDRKALPMIEPDGTGSVVLATSDVEEKILEIWRRVIKLEAVGVHTNFFDAGGNSLKLLQVQSLYAEYSGDVIPLARFFEYPTIHEFAAFIGRGGRRSKTHESRALGPVNRLRARQKRLRKE